ncbi:hypothetical protein HBI56_089400 [Parastagonospora nodorum]|nr:hypothetical protein HBH51_092480 [Parastagonospora nodorum]KAH4266460.1 hypothetical protein HBI03_076970 [Parastagonospora nodorum]KAH4275645.1 hypothetical protein HBI04_124150 [Parastagonospora nodorum]KAH4347824.1 hypothetical protein HBH98_086260 [Parastagonospora nodorum]KAH4377489.1 hypothetical protein HBH97_109690 [Parastagonospora nodorum]
MVRRSPGFISKKPHRKSRGGCLTCKRKKVKCDEAQPACGYCALRRLDCDYPTPYPSPPTSSPSTTHSSSPPTQEIDFNTNFQILRHFQPSITTASGPLSPLELSLLHHYQTTTWKTFVVRGNTNTHAIHHTLVPKMSIAHPHLLYAILSISASHLAALQPASHLTSTALLYRQKTYQTYVKELAAITPDSYEAIVTTAYFLLTLIPRPGPDTPDEECLEFMMTLLKLSEGLRILVTLRWSQGIEKLAVYPLICRELRSLPPAPVVVTEVQVRPGPVGSTPAHPNPAATYDEYVLPFAASVFLPPPLLGLLESIVKPEDVVLDVDANTLIPVFHVLSPVFLSLYYYHLNPDFNVRIVVFTSFLMPDFLALVKAREPRALVLMAWFFVMSDMVPNGWWVGNKVGVVAQALSRTVRKVGSEKVIEALEGAERVIDVHQREGRERAAESVFDGWEGVNWDEGPRRAREWEEGLANLTKGFDLCNLDFEIP